MVLLMQRAKRFECAAPVAFWWPLAQGAVQSGMGVTQNIGNSGVMIAANECPPAGVHIQMTVFLPRFEGSGYAMKLHGEGVVTRVESETLDSDERPIGFAASVQFYPEPMDASEQASNGGNGAADEADLSGVLQSARRNYL